MRIILLNGKLSQSFLEMLGRWWNPRHLGLQGSQDYCALDHTSRILRITCNGGMRRGCVSVGNVIAISISMCLTKLKSPQADPQV
jgi:hypothetical protein